MSKSGSWVKLANVCDVPPGRGFDTGFEANGETIGLFCVDGKYYALGECTHEQGPLCQGIIEGSEVTCPWHSAKFDITTGKCLSPPSACRVLGNVAESSELEQDSIPDSRAYPTKVERDAIFVLVS